MSFTKRKAAFSLHVPTYLYVRVYYSRIVPVIIANRVRAVLYERTRRKNAIKKHVDRTIWNSKHVRTILLTTISHTRLYRVLCVAHKIAADRFTRKTTAIARTSNANQPRQVCKRMVIFFFQKHKLPPEIFEIDCKRHLQLTTARRYGRNWFFLRIIVRRTETDSTIVCPNTAVVDSTVLIGVKRVFTEQWVHVYKHRRSNYYIIYPQRRMSDERFRRQTRQTHFNRANKQ